MGGALWGWVGFGVGFGVGVGACKVRGGKMVLFAKVAVSGALSGISFGGARLGKLL